jgi:hypothetical protein
MELVLTKRGSTQSRSAAAEGWVPGPRRRWSSARSASTGHARPGPVRLGTACR